MRRIPQACVDLIKSKEQCVLYVYDDAHYPPRRSKTGATPEGTWTGGYGHTGNDVRPGMTVSQALADSWLNADLQHAAFALDEKISAVEDELTDNQYAALLDFVFNAGVGSSKKPEWTIWKRVRAKQFDQVPLELAKFVNTHINGKTVKENGLVTRRNLEIELWSKDEPGTVNIERPSSVTRMVSTPPTPSEPATPVKSTTIISGVVASIATVPVAVKQVSDAISPYADKSPMVANTVAILATIAALCVGLTVLFAYLHNRKARN